MIYFSQIDTNNAILANFSDMRYERGLSVAVVDFTPHIYNQNGSSPRLYKEGTIGIDVIGNWTLFNSLSGDSEEELKIRHSSGYLSSFYESEVIEQFTGMQSVSTAEVLDRAIEQDVDILYLSKVNISELDTSSLSAKNKVDITKLLNEGMCVTVPNTEITIDSWSGIGYIVYDPAIGTNTYIINTNLNGGNICSWVGLAYFCDILVTVVECTWAFDLVMFGAAFIGTGLMLFTGPIGIAAFAFTATGLGAIISGGFYIKNIGDRLYSHTELMNLYLDGNEEAGELLKLKAGFHIMFTGIGTIGMDLMSKGVSVAFAKTQIGNKIGNYFANAFEGTKYGVDGALDILNNISPKYVETLTTLIDSSGKGAADFISEDKDIDGIKEIEKTLEIFEESSGNLKYKYNGGDSTWTSNEGIIYRQGSAEGNRVLHVLEHLKPKPLKPTHTVFNVDKSEVIGLIDEAWVIKGTGTLQSNGNAIYEVNMGRIIGKNGEDTIIIITNGFTNEIVTAYPKAI